MPYAGDYGFSIQGQLPGGQIEEDDYDDSYPPPCTNKSGHEFVCSDENEEISYCQWCCADGNA